MKRMNNGVLKSFINGHNYLKFVDIVNIFVGCIDTKCLVRIIVRKIIDSVHKSSSAR